MYTASADKTVRVWDLNSKRCVQVRAGRRRKGLTRVGREGAAVHTTLCRKRGRLGCLLACRQSGSKLSELSRPLPQVLESHTRPVLSLAMCGNRLFSGSYDYSIRVWNLDTLQVGRVAAVVFGGQQACAEAGPPLPVGSCTLSNQLCLPGRRLPGPSAYLTSPSASINLCSGRRR